MPARLRSEVHSAAGILQPDPRGNVKKGLVSRDIEMSKGMTEPRDAAWAPTNLCPPPGRGRIERTLSWVVRLPEVLFEPRVDSRPHVADVGRANHAVTLSPVPNKLRSLVLSV